MLETLLQIIKFLQELGLTPINLLLVSMLYFMGAKSDFFPISSTNRIITTIDWDWFKKQFRPDNSVNCFT